MWEMFSAHYDPLGNLDFTFEVDRSSGAQRVTDYDQLNQNGWSIWSVVYDAAGRVDYTSAVWDSGLRTDTDYDLLNQQWWSVNTLQYDAQGRLDYQWTYADAGGRFETDYDQLNQHWWSRNTLQYDAQNRLDYQWTHADEGWRFETFYDPANQFSWSKKIFQFDAAGRIDYTWEVLDSGARIEVDYDAVNQHNWSARATSVSSSGSVSDVKVILDAVAPIVMAANVKWSVDAGGKLQISIRDVSVPGQTPVPAVDPLAPPGDPYYLSAPSARLTSDQLLGPTGYDPYAPGRGVRVVYTSNGDPQLQGELSADDIKYILKNFNNDVTSLVDGIKSSWNGFEDNVLHPIANAVNDAWRWVTSIFRW